jgi:hypothetical protein
MNAAMRVAIGLTCVIALYAIFLHEPLAFNANTIPPILIGLGALIGYKLTSKEADDDKAE